uniref:Uncharacterized protein n=1 Tax=Chromera velia CCMP2878 TaxID=1169474 RepID=A0A0G4FUP5_9ALVE|eukprot:Cvel_18853.t1-p1 / transcript=Cvel_18853.t1 / gene=Cvel_18853 / organism=Chromera_velia_CCMP2878 / gene_product=hypothetical protein / transcript_product=hypothetical protein / location=Cvel_scaffold1585:29136-29660(-) / protein_length=105 / sequence_SO=supercontig / SO=protein_coding / is_pseudo=false
MDLVEDWTVKCTEAARGRERGKGAGQKLRHKLVDPRAETIYPIDLFVLRESKKGSLTAIEARAVRARTRIDSALSSSVCDEEGEGEEEGECSLSRSNVQGQKTVR